MVDMATLRQLTTMTSVTAALEACGQLSRFLQLPEAADNRSQLELLLKDLLRCYASDDALSRDVTQANTAAQEASRRASAAVDGVVLVTLQKLLSGVITTSGFRVQESAFAVFLRILERGSGVAIYNSEHALLGYVQR